MTNPLTTPKGPVAIRPALREDAAPLRELRLEALAAHPEAYSSDYATSAAEPVAQWAERIAAYAAGRTGVIYVAAAENGLIGMTGLYCGNRPKTRHTGTIWGVYVRPEWRGYHVAQALVQACLAWAQAQGLVMAKVGVITSNTPAIRCYAGCGFTVYGVDPKAICCDGVYHDELLMARPV